MRYLVVSDLHGNWPALEAVLREARDYDAVLFLGDAVGYYPDANRVLDWLRSVNARGVMGNHDLWLLEIGSMQIDGPVLEILAWQAERLSPENRAYLKGLPWTLEVEGALLVHGSPLDPLAYLEELEQAREVFARTSHRLIFHGHTHLAGSYLALEKPGQERLVRYQNYARGGELIVAPKARAIINPGSIGQPRDGVVGAAYAIWDVQEDTIEFHRTRYDLEQVLARLHHEQFPMWLYERLVLGK
ncbi:metallophosphoesterase [Meiothermus sp. QL-1]|uniref:metallophosphoesterase family protein n=1 Tax=Meiothermus sp. QL-1 TaxID=2058095 RepID=UPI000E0AAE84|nr:metallophosphoesterase family protein [Meiothermus sp. QL-1]RDI95677.1 metallophosphoesterase [Meiothermus sp. QL-1]